MYLVYALSRVASTKCEIIHQIRERARLWMCTTQLRDAYVPQYPLHHPMPRPNRRLPSVSPPRAAHPFLAHHTTAFVRKMSVMKALVREIEVQRAPSVFLDIFSRLRATGTTPGFADPKMPNILMMKGLLYGPAS